MLLLTHHQHGVLYIEIRNIKYNTIKLYMYISKFRQYPDVSFPTQINILGFMINTEYDLIHSYHMKHALFNISKNSYQGNLLYLTLPITNIKLTIMITEIGILF